MRFAQIFIILLALALTGCTDAAYSSLASYGSSATVVCYSGGTVIYDGESTGRVASTAQSDGWEFNEKTTNKFKRVSGDCVVTN